MRRIHRAQTHERQHYRAIERLGKAREQLALPGGNDSAARIDDRSVAPGEQASELRADVGAQGIRECRGDSDYSSGGVTRARDVRGQPSLLYVLRKVEQHRSWPATEGRGRRHAHCGNDFSCVVYLPCELRDRPYNTDNVAFLKGIASEPTRRDIACDAQDRNGVAHRVGDTGDEIRRSRSGGHYAYAQTSGRARVALRCKHRALLVLGAQQTESRLGQGVKYFEAGAARMSKDRGDAQIHQRIRYQPGPPRCRHFT